MKKTGKIAALVILVVCIVIGGRQLLSKKIELTYQHLYSSKIVPGTTVRMLVIADLHNTEFGTDNAELIKTIQEQNPDVILIAGDMVNKWDEDIDTAVRLCQNLVKIAPVYYGFGNHEGTLEYSKGVPVSEKLRETGAEVLINSSREIQIKGTSCLIGSVSTGIELYDTYSKEFMEEFQKSEDFKVLIAHMPDLFYEKLADAKVDLSVSGHYHGGQVWIPGIGGLYSVEHGFFPKYSGGMYQLSEGNLLVTRGLGNSHKIPRINNRPEVVIIDVNGRQ